ncbi:hypothetical protein A3460_02210 [Enterobacter roggenkampii]|nr:hypothetical protein A3460_02210 [Enterobacter roggenkampii]
MVNYVLAEPNHLTYIKRLLLGGFQMIGVQFLLGMLLISLTLIPAIGTQMKVRMVIQFVRQKIFMAVMVLTIVNLKKYQSLCINRKIIGVNSLHLMSFLLEREDWV